jgi:hypothetical protein
VHACLQARNLPIAFVQRVFRRFGSEQFRIKNTQGNLPLHYAAEQLPGMDSVDFLPLILSGYLEGASVRNQQGKLPLDLAVDAGRRWNTGIRLLLNAHPLALQTQAIQYILFPMILGELLQEDDKSIAFGLLRCNADVFPAAVSEHQQESVDTPDL